MRLVVYYVAQSLDGFIAQVDGDMDWLTELSAGAEDDGGYTAFLRGVGTVVMGRRTYDDCLRLNSGMWPYAGKEAFVFSRDATLQSANVTFVTDDPIKFVRNLRAAAPSPLSPPQGDVWFIGGSALAGLLLDAGLIDRIVVTIAPIILGAGVPTFGPPVGDGVRDVRLALYRSHTLTNGMVTLEYNVNI